MNQKSKAAARFMSSMYSLMACRHCNGWSRGFNLRFWDTQDCTHYAGLISKTEGDEECRGETLSFTLVPFIEAAAELGLSIQSLHYTDPNVFNVSVIHDDTGIVFGFYLLLNPTEFLFPAELVRGMTERELTDVSFEDVSEDEYRELFHKFLRSKAKPDPSPAVESPTDTNRVKGTLVAVHNTLQAFGLTVADLSLSTVLPTLVASIGHEYNHERVAKLQPMGRAAIVAWSLQQLVRLRCNKGPAKVPPEYQSVLWPIAKSTSA